MAFDLAWPVILGIVLLVLGFTSDHEGRDKTCIPLALVKLEAVPFLWCPPIPPLPSAKYSAVFLSISSA